MEEQNEETVEETNEETNEEENSEESTEESTDLEEKVKELEGRNKRLQTKLDKKAKAPDETKKTNKKPDAPDYALQALLEVKGFTNPDDQQMIREEATRLKLPVTDVLGMEHMAAKLKNASDQRKLEDGMPKGKGKSGGNTKADVDYWLAKGETPKDQELAEKVIDARIKKEKSSNKFADELY